MKRAAAIDRALLAVRPPDPTGDEVREATPRVLAKLDAQLHDVEDVLRAARPPDPGPADVEDAAVRVLARVEMLASGDGAAPRSGRHSRWPAMLRIAAAFLVVLLATQVIDVAPEAPVDPPSTEPEPACDVLVTCVEDAIAGDALARHRVLTAGPGVRDVLLARAEQRDEGSAYALGLLRAVGGIRRETEARRLRELARTESVRRPAIDLLATAPTSAGARELGVLLVEEPSAAAYVVERLVDVAERGRRSAAADALLEGVAAGRVDAAVVAFEVTRASELERLLAALPDGLIEHARVAAAVSRAPVTTRDRLVRRAVEGDHRALRLATTANLAGIAPSLRAAALDVRPERARWAVGALVRQGDLASWLVVVEALSGGAEPEARRALAAMPADVVAELERGARRDSNRRRAHLAALAAGGSAGTEALERLAEAAALRAPAIDALAASRSPAAVAVLERLGHGSSESDRALVALAKRLDDGDRAAGRALLRVARTRPSRRVLRLLEQHATGGGRPWLEGLLDDATLPESVRAALLRASGRKRSAPHADGVRVVRRPGTRTAPSPIT